MTRRLVEPVAVVTGASRGLGLALSRALVGDGWLVIGDARSEAELTAATQNLGGPGRMVSVPGDVADPEHRQRLASLAAQSAGPTSDGLRLLVNNASYLGPSPQPLLQDYPLQTLRQVFEVNYFAPLGLIQLLIPLMTIDGVIINITSDAGLEGYAGWGGYGSSKAALEQVSRVLAEEQPQLRIYWVDPGDMNTRMQQEAFPGEDISDRPPPEGSLPGLLELVQGRRASGRYPDPIDGSGMMTPVLDFELPTRLEASAPPEEQGVPRDQVRMMVGLRSSGEIVDDVFASLPSYLRSGDALVINISATIPAALPARTADGLELLVHLSTMLEEGLWTVEVRQASGHGSLPGPDLDSQCLTLAGGGELTLLSHPDYSQRMWLARLRVPGDVHAYLAENGRPIRYRYAAAPWDLNAYQTVYAREPGSVEMPSAGRPFTTRLLARLVAGGVVVVPVVLHAGVASLEFGEKPAPERMRVPVATASAVNALRDGGRVIAVGTTVTRALESAAEVDGTVRATEGLTDIVIGPDRPTRVVDGLITGWHEPKASHLELVEAVAGSSLATRMYQRALATGYLWHEFGDSCLILP